MEKNFGRADLMAIAAVRYCIGHTSYIVSDCADWLIEQWPNIEPGARKTIIRDIEEAFSRDNEDRDGNRTHRALGHDCDRQTWERVRKLWRAEE